MFRNVGLPIVAYKTLRKIDTISEKITNFEPRFF